LNDKGGFMETKKVAVLTVDVSKSREFEDRGELQIKIKNAIKEVNSKYKNNLLAKFSITLGDEFQGAIKDKELSYDMLTRIEDLLYPTKVKGGLGLGRVETSLSEKVMEMDGSAFHRSREALKKAKNSNVEMVVVSGQEDFDATINTILELLSIIKNQWTKRQREVVTYLRGRDVTLEKAGEKFGVTKQSLSKTRKKTNFKSVASAETEIRRLLGKVKMVDN